MKNENEIRLCSTETYTTAHELINVLEQREVVISIFKDHESGALLKSDALYKLSNVTPDPISRALFRKWYHESSKEEIASLRMCANMASLAKYGSASHRNSSRLDLLDNLSNNWIKAAKNNHDYFYGFVQEGVVDHIWQRDNFVSAFDTRMSVPVKSRICANSIRFILRYGTGLHLSNYIFEIPFHVRSMMVIRGMIRK